MSNSNRYQRRHTRELVMQALYQWSLSATPLTSLQKSFRKHAIGQDKQPDWGYFDRLLSGILEQQGELDKRIVAHSDLDFNRLSLVELAILRLGAYELAQEGQVPPRVVIDEALEMSKKYGAEGSYKFINAMLDKMWTKPNC